MAKTRPSELGSGSGSSSGKSSLDENGKSMNKMLPKLEKLQSFALADASDGSESGSSSSPSSSEGGNSFSAYPRTMGNKRQATKNAGGGNDGGSNITSDDVDAMMQLSAKHVVADGVLTGANIKELSILSTIKP